MNKAVSLLGWLGALGICIALPALLVPLVALISGLIAHWHFGLGLLLTLAVGALAWRRFAGEAAKIVCAQARRCGCTS